MANEETAAELVALARAVGLKGYASQPANGSQERSLVDPEAAELVTLARSVGLAGYSPLPDEAHGPAAAMDTTAATAAANPVSASPAAGAPMTDKDRATKRKRDEAIPNDAQQANAWSAFWAERARMAVKPPLLDHMRGSPLLKFVSASRMPSIAAKYPGS